MNAPEADGRGRAGRLSAETMVAWLAPLVAGAVSVGLGADFNYDLRHYHFYNGYALAHGRFDHDFAPAGIQSFFNPLQDVLYYLGIRHLPPRLFAFLLGAVHGLGLVLVHRIALRVLAGDPKARLLALLATVLAGLGSDALSLLGTTTGDALVTLPVLLALLLAMGHARGSALRAGLLAGVAAGLKLTMLVPAAALAVALPAGRARGKHLAALSSFAAGGALGFLAAGGFWCRHLFARFANPLFPFFNGFFRSPFFRADNAIEPRFVAHTWWEALSLPLDMAMGWTSGLQEIRFREPRFLLVFAALLLWLLARARFPGPPEARPLGPEARPLGPEARRLLAFWIAGYLLWAYGLHYYRYAAVFESLAPLVVLVLVRATPWGRATRPGAALLAAGLLVIAFSRPVSWGRTAWSGDWFGVRLPEIDRPAESLVVLAGERVAYVAPYFPEATRFVGLTRRGSPGLDGLIAERLAAHRGPVYLLPGVGATPDDAFRFGFTPAGECLPLATRDGGLCLYPLRRVSGP